jgi:periplasmic copper chaperone A
MNRSSVSLPRSLARLCVVLLAALTALAAGIGVAAAHVSVSSQDAAPGGYGKVTFRVPNESATANTIGIRIQIPTDQPLASLSTQPVPGWTASVSRTQLDPPVTDDDGNKVTEAVSVVEFTASPGGGIGPGEFQEFALSGGPFPKADSLTFPVVQTYSDGSESAWIEPSVDGQAEPEHPAPVLKLTAASADSAAPTGSTAADHTHGETTSQPAGLALLVSVLALLVAIGGGVLAVRANRRTVSS